MNLEDLDQEFEDIWEDVDLDLDDYTPEDGIYAVEVIDITPARIKDATVIKLFFLQPVEINDKTYQKKVENVFWKKSLKFMKSFFRNAGYSPEPGLKLSEYLSGAQETLIGRTIKVEQKTNTAKDKNGQTREYVNFYAQQSQDEMDLTEFGSASDSTELPF